jgi:hypothetical protein
MYHLSSTFRFHIYGKGILTTHDQKDSHLLLNKIQSQNVCRAVKEKMVLRIMTYIKPSKRTYKQFDKVKARLQFYD